MGRIFDEVLTNHLRYYPSERDAILPFQHDFNITWAARRTAYGSDFSSYILKPESTIRELFGLGIEVALFVFEYDALEARTFQAINQALTESPLAGRVEPSTYILLSKDPKAQSFTSDYLMRIPQSRNPIPISISQLKSSLTNKFDLRDLIAKFAYRRDLFDYRLPIDTDTYFFGRETLVSELQDQIKKAQNSGIFGLRKTGKTSLLYKVSRDSEANNIATTVYIDCKNPIIRKKNSISLTEYIVKQIAFQENIPPKRYEKLDAFEAFSEVVKISSKKKTLCLIFDEIEYISPFSLTDPQWEKEFVDFWQLVWSTQSQTGKLSFIVSGVNAAVCETSTFSGIQNPLFGIVNTTYVQGLDTDSLSRMVKYFGGQMGLDFTEDSTNLLDKYYGGHPLLTRMACSFIHVKLEREKRNRPIKITSGYIQSILRECDSAISPYCAHVVGELKDFYPDEYEVIRMASVGLKSDFLEYGSDPNLSRHLKAYGILSANTAGTPNVSLPVLANFLKAEHVRLSGGKIPRDLVLKDRRTSWIGDTLSRIIHDMRGLFQTCPTGTTLPFGSKGIPDSDLLQNVTLVETKEDFRNFITPMYNIFYENISRGYPARNDFNTTFKQDWPALFDAVDRIRTYRDFTHHLDLSESTRSRYEKYLSMDIGGLEPEKEQDGWFGMQQASLDELLYAIQVETAAKAS